MQKRDPFRIEGPALISFSGGRTSGYMLRRILDAGMDSDTRVVFADTGKERAETYDFVRAVQSQWGVEIHWVGRPGGFAQLIKDKQMLPHTRMRFCTQHLKVIPIRDFGRSLGWTEWTGAIGIRADEPRRLAKMRGKPNDCRGEEHVYPLAEAGITLADVTAFWQAQPFDLQLQPWEGNCDLCFLKGQKKRIRIMQDRPDLAEWWIEQEAAVQGFFRAPPRPNYAQLLQIAQHPRLFEPDAQEPDDLDDCACTD